jgi:iron complex transport system substrate-binding protein
MLTRLKATIHISLFCIVVISAAPLPAQTDAKTNTLVDSLGRQVEVPAVIRRIACMYAFTGHVVAMLGRADDIVAVSNGLKRDVLLSTMYPAFRKALVPKFQGAVNIEELARAKPDIVFVGVDTGGNKAEAAKLDACGLTWLAIDFHSMQEQQQAVALIGRAIGASDKSTAYNDYYNKCIARAGCAVAAIPQEKRITIYHATVEPTRTSPRDSLPTDWIRAAGVVNVAARDQGRLLDQNQQIGIEQIILWDPEVILVNEPGVAELIMKNPKWSAISAVEKGRVYQLPIGISRWGHPGSLETPLAILWTAKTVYPDQFRDLDMNVETSGFYKTFFNYALSDDMIRQIMEGKGMRLTKNRKKKQ